MIMVIKYSRSRKRAPRMPMSRQIQYRLAATRRKLGRSLQGCGMLDGFSQYQEDDKKQGKVMGQIDGLT